MKLRNPGLTFLAWLSKLGFKRSVPPAEADVYKRMWDIDPTIYPNWP